MIATTRDQSARLLKCGVPAETADMTWIDSEGDLLIVQDYENTKWLSQANHYTPAWSLSRLIELLPESIKHDGVECTLSMSKTKGFQIAYYGLGYILARISPLKINDTSPIETCVKSIEWLISNDYPIIDI